MSNQGIIKDITLNLDINARKRVEGKVDIKLYSKDIATGQFEFTLIDENENPVVLDETYSAQALVKYEGDSKTYLDDMTIEGNIIRFIFPHDFITKDGIVTMYIYVTKDNYTSDVAAISFNVYRSEIDEIATDVVAIYDKNYEDILADFKQALEDYKLTLPQADSVRADIDEILNQFSEDSQAKLSQYDTDVQQVITDINEAETSRVEAEVDRTSSESSRVEAEKQRGLREASRVEAEGQRDLAESSRLSAESDRESAEAQRKTDHANRSAELDGKADKVVIKNLIENGNFESPSPTPVGTGTTMSDGVLEFTGDSTFSRFGFLGNPVILGHKYYIQFKARYIGDKPTSGALSLTGTGFDFYYHRSLGEPNSWTTISDIIDSNRTSNDSTYVYLIGTAQYDDFILIDLTETFGAGNEPTKEEMDKLIEVTGYIDDEYALNNKDMLGHLMKGISEKANKKQEDWITPTLLNGWYAIRPNEPPQYMKDEFGFVHFRGAISKGESATSNVAFQLPIGYCPNVRTTFGVPEIKTSPSTLALTISPSGNVDFAGAALNSWFAISYITFKAV